MDALQMVDGLKQYESSFTQKQHFNLNSEAQASLFI